MTNNSPAVSLSAQYDELIAQIDAVKVKVGGLKPHDADAHAAARAERMARERAAERVRRDLLAHGTQVPDRDDAWCRQMSDAELAA